MLGLAVVVVVAAAPTLINRHREEATRTISRVESTSSGPSSSTPINGIRFRRTDAPSASFGFPTSCISRSTVRTTQRPSTQGELNLLTVPAPPT